MARAERPSLASLPDLMDVDLSTDLPDDLFEFDNQFLDEYLKRVRGPLPGEGALLLSGCSNWKSLAIAPSRQSFLCHHGRCTSP